MASKGAHSNSVNFYSSVLIWYKIRKKKCKLIQKQHTKNQLILNQTIIIIPFYVTNH
jgi:hypothetical protein